MVDVDDKGTCMSIHIQIKQWQKLSSYYFDFLWVLKDIGQEYLPNSKVTKQTMEIIRRILSRDIKA